MNRLYTIKWMTKGGMEPFAGGYLKVLSYEKYQDIPEGNGTEISACTYQS